MGNRVGTILWSESTIDDQIREDLNILKDNYNLAEADVNFAHYESGMNSFAVSVDGLWNIFQDDSIIKSFLFDAEKLISRKNYTMKNVGEKCQIEVMNDHHIRTKTHYEYLQM